MDRISQPPGDTELVLHGPVRPGKSSIVRCGSVGAFRPLRNPRLVIFDEPLAPTSDRRPSPSNSDSSSATVSNIEQDYRLMQGFPPVLLMFAAPRPGQRP